VRIDLVVLAVISKLVMMYFFLWLCSDLACHIDGFIAAVAHTHVLQEGPVTGRAADVIAAANTAAEVALRLVRPGKKVINCKIFPSFSCIFIMN
jgi:hypothetical protein